MPPSASALLAALVGLCVAGCAVDRSGLFRVDGGTAPFDAGPVDLGVQTDAPDVDFGGTDLGGDDLGGSDFGPDDLGPNDLGSDLGPDDLGPAPCVDGGVRSHRSCREWRDDACFGPTPDGVYAVDLDGAGPAPSIQVYCDMTIAGGGWTLVARTFDIGMTVGFGWTTPFGSVDADVAPYSLGLGDMLAFSEIIVGRRGVGKTWGSNPVYHFTVPLDFVTMYASTAYAISDLTVVQGPCTPPAGGPSMLRYVGHTGATDHFFFSDGTAIGGTGMFSNAFVLIDSSCAASGSLSTRSGMIMVR